MALPIGPLGDQIAGRSRRIHVVCGGGTGAAALAGLTRRGYTVSAGVLNRLDSDEQACIALGIEHVAEAPFCPIGEAARQSCRALLRRAESVVITDVPIGRGNMANLELAAEAQDAGAPVYLLGSVRHEDRDFTGGAAAEALRLLEARGARRIPEISTLVAEIEDRCGA
jgi:iron complex transport system ATP-binding protein